MKSTLHCLPSQNTCGESPMWDARLNRLFWVDTETPVLCSFDPARGAKSVGPSDWLIQAIGPRKSGGWVAVVRDGFALLEKEAGRGRFLGNPVEGKAAMAMNDGAVGPDGRFYAGSLNKDILEAPDGCLHRLDTDLSIHTIETGLVLPNGISFSPDGKTMYVTEMWATDHHRLRFRCPSGRRLATTGAHQGARRGRLSRRAHRGRRGFPVERALAGISRDPLRSRRTKGAHRRCAGSDRDVHGLWRESARSAVHHDREKGPDSRAAGEISLCRGSLHDRAGCPWTAGIRVHGLKKSLTRFEG